MENNVYTKKVLKTFKNPHNYGTMKNPDGVGLVGNPTCGDVMKLYIKVGKPASAKASARQGGEVIKDIKFETFGCVAAIATSSIITDMVKGKTIKYAMNITKEGVVEKLGGLPKIKYHCSVLAVDALFKAIKDYESKKK